MGGPLWLAGIARHTVGTAGVAAVPVATVDWRLARNRVQRAGAVLVLSAVAIGITLDCINTRTCAVVAYASRALNVLCTGMAGRDGREAGASVQRSPAGPPVAQQALSSTRTLIASLLTGLHSNATSLTRYQNPVTDVQTQQDWGPAAV